MLIGVNRKRFWIAAVIGVAVFVYTVKQADLKTLLNNVHDLDRFWSVMAIIASALSYLCIAAVLYRLLRGMGYKLPFAASLRISLLSCTLNYVMAFGGLSGVAAKVYLLSRERVPPSNTLSISMVHGFLTNTVAIIFIYLGFFYLYSEYKMSAREIEAALFVMLVAFLLTWITVQTLVHESFRKRLWQICLWTASTLSRKLRSPGWFHQEKAEAFFQNFNQSMNFIVRNAKILIAPASFALLDWILMLLCLKWSFLAVNYPVDNSALLVGFSVGIFTTLFSLTPVSIGVMEGSMAGSFYLMGLDYDRALLATLIYRFFYFFLPILASMFTYRHFFTSSARHIELDQDR